MSHDNQQPHHVILPAPKWSRREQSRWVAREFCDAYQLQFGITATLQDVEIDELDAIVQIGDEKIALEFTGYRQRDELHKFEIPDSDLKKAVSKALDDKGVPDFEVWFRYKEKPRADCVPGAVANDATVPIKKDHARFAIEIAELAKKVKINPDLMKRQIIFRPQGRRARERKSSPFHVVATDQFPMLARFCSSIRIQASKDSILPTIRSSADVRHLSLDKDQLRRIVRKHASTIESYRERAGEMPVWLVVHADGLPLSTCLHRHDRPKALEIIREETTYTFDRVWWMDWEGSCGKKLFEV